MEPLEMNGEVGRYEDVETPRETRMVRKETYRGREVASSSHGVLPNGWTLVRTSHLGRPRIHAITKELQ